MPVHEFQLDCAIRDSFRVRQVAGMFDLPVEDPPPQRFRADLPDLREPWQIGLIVGPSASGKSTLARRVFAAPFTIRATGQATAPSSTHSTRICQSSRSRER